jgi:hypothetical protein
VDGELAEVALDYFAQADDGTVYHFGVDVYTYRNGEVASHEGSWRYGVNTNQLGIIMPAQPEVGSTFQAENVPGITTVDDEVLSVSERVQTPAGTFRNCLKIQETLSDGSLQFKYYAPNMGVIKEETRGGSIQQISSRNPHGRDPSGSERED